jgi:hypothetical protein
MILVKRNQEDSSQKVISGFLKRVKKSNLVARKRKTQHNTKPLSDLEKRRKAVRKSAYLANQIITEKVGKK